jgi:uncharacterized protein YegJ (DUF2314 family)
VPGDHRRYPALLNESIPAVTKPFLLVLAITLSAGCGGDASSSDKQLEVVQFDGDDREMNDAMVEARRTFDFFQQNWKTMENDGYSLKFALETPDDGLEYIWFSPLTIEGDKITGECANHPEEVANLKLGDKRTVTRDRISDWMIVVGDQCYGGYTIRVISKRDPNATPPMNFVDPPKQ